MDEFDNDLTVHYFITQENIEIKTIYFLLENNAFIIAVSWVECDEAHFKMFKNLGMSNVKIFCDFLLEYDKNWYKLAINWVAKPTMPLRLKPS